MKIQNKKILFTVSITFGIFLFLIFFGNFSFYLDNNTVYALTKLENNNFTSSSINFEDNNNTVKEKNETNNDLTDLTITIKSEKLKYYNDDILRIFGNVYDNNLNLTKTVLFITPNFTERTFLEEKEPVTLQKTTIPVIDGSYNFTQYLDKTGLYNISVSDKDGNNKSYLVINANNKFFSYTYILIYFTIVLLILYGIITWYAVRIKIIDKYDKKQIKISWFNSISSFFKKLALKFGIININKDDKNKKELEDENKKELEDENKKELEDENKKELEDENKKELEDENKKELEDEKKSKSKIAASKFKYEITRFFILSGISILPLVSFLVLDVEIGKFSPLGLVMQNTQTTNDTQQDIRNVQWVINIGGNAVDNYSSGIIIPFYVFALGWAGGYLRYLHRTISKIQLLHKDLYELNTALWPYLRDDEEYLNKYEYKINSLPLFLYASFEELAEILLAPLLAIAVFFLLRIGNMTDPFSVSLISFSVGLITKDVVDRIIGFSKNTIGQQSPTPP